MTLNFDTRTVHYLLFIIQQKKVHFYNKYMKKDDTSEHIIDCEFFCGFIKKDDTSEHIIDCEFCLGL